jgi:hypothetical protein
MSTTPAPSLCGHRVDEAVESALPTRTIPCQKLRPFVAVANESEHDRRVIAIGLLLVCCATVLIRGNDTRSIMNSFLSESPPYAPGCVQHYGRARG